MCGVVKSSDASNQGALVGKRNLSASAQGGREEKKQKTYSEHHLVAVPFNAPAITKPSQACTRGPINRTIPSI